MTYPTPDDAVHLHRIVLKATGGAPGIRDLGLLESALARPLSSYEGVEFYPTLWSKTGALTHGIMRNHPFVDGNKRTAMVLALTFLLLNGYFLDVSQEEFEATALATADGSLGPSELANWFERNAVREG